MEHKLVVNAATTGKMQEDINYQRLRRITNLKSEIINLKTSFEENSDYVLNKLGKYDGDIHTLP